jgi:hypothetical protein
VFNCTTKNSDINLLEICNSSRNISKCLNFPFKTLILFTLFDNLLWANVLQIFSNSKVTRENYETSYRHNRPPFQLCLVLESKALPITKSRRWPKELIKSNKARSISKAGLFWNESADLQVVLKLLLITRLHNCL